MIYAFKQDKISQRNICIGYNSCIKCGFHVHVALVRANCGDRSCHLAALAPRAPPQSSSLQGIGSSYIDRARLLSARPASAGLYALPTDTTVFKKMFHQLLSFVFAPYEGSEFYYNLHFRQFNQQISIELIRIY